VSKFVTDYISSKITAYYLVFVVATVSHTSAINANGDERITRPLSALQNDFSALNQLHKSNKKEILEASNI
jgi:hypothetical protein